MAMPAAHTLSNVLIVGKTGAGKSTLGNLLIYDAEEKEGGFPVGHGHKSETVVCASRSVVLGSVHLTVVDSPGVPDTNRARSLQCYDDIVREMRGMPQINAILFMVAMDRTDNLAYADMRALFKQFNPVPCVKIMVCRVRMRSQCDATLRGKLEEGANSLISTIVEMAGLSFVKPFILHDTEKQGIEDLRRMVLNMPGTEMADATLRTHEEMVYAYRLLSNQASRLDALKAETVILRNSKRQLEDEVIQLSSEISAKKKNITKAKAATAVVVTGAGLADFALLGLASVLVGIPAAVAGAGSVGALKKQISDREVRHQAALYSISIVADDIESKEEEIRSGTINEHELNHAQYLLNELETLAQT